MILRKQFIIWLLLMVFFLPGLAIASPREDAIKSGFLYNFARYSQGEWFTPGTHSSYNICSFNEQFIEAANLTLKKMTIEDLPVVVNLLTSEYESIIDCDTLFLSKADIAKWQYLSATEQLSEVMLVGEFDDFLDSGGHINFFIVGGKIRFEVNPVKLKASGINMSSKVLRLGRVHKGEL